MDFRKVLYVGGLDPLVNEHVLQTAFIPFGPIRAVEIPKENVTLELNSLSKTGTSSNANVANKSLSSSRGFGYVEFEYVEDAAAAKDNMDNAQLYGRTLRVDIANKQNISNSASKGNANSNQNKSTVKLGSSKPAWHELNEWYRNKLNSEGFANDDDAREHDVQTQKAKQGTL